MIWGNLLHLSYNMWEEADTPIPKDISQERRQELRNRRVRPNLRFDEEVWDDLLSRMCKTGMNMVVIDLGDGIRYESHPEIAVSDAWTREKLRQELRKLRKMGLEPIPKLNFSTSHDAWLRQYSRMVSTDAYYAVCKDLITEVIDLFNKPRFFHLGMDEENSRNQWNYNYLVVRQGALWWHDLLFLIKQVEHTGVRAWIWSDVIWDHSEEFFARMPKSVLQSNWYYHKSFNTKLKYVKTYLDLDGKGYDQIPTGSNWATAENFEKTVAFCTRHITSERLVGFLQTPWRPTIKKYRHVHIEAIERVARARAKLNVK